MPTLTELTSEENYSDTKTQIVAHANGEIVLMDETDFLPTFSLPEGGGSGGGTISYED